MNNHELTSLFDEYFEPQYESTLEYDSMFDYGSTPSYTYTPNLETSNYIEYTWIISEDRAIYGIDRCEYIDGVRVFKTNEDILEYRLYTFGAYSKQIAFIGSILTTMKNYKNPSIKLKKIYQMLLDLYPEIVIKIYDCI